MGGRESTGLCLLGAAFGLGTVMLMSHCRVLNFVTALASRTFAPYVIYVLSLLKGLIGWARVDLSRRTVGIPINFRASSGWLNGGNYRTVHSKAELYVIMIFD